MRKRLIFALAAATLVSVQGIAAAEGSGSWLKGLFSSDPADAAASNAPAPGIAMDTPGSAPVPAEPVMPDSDRVAPTSVPEIKLSFAPLVKRSAPAVVNVYAARTVRQRSPYADDPFFEQFFGGRQPRQQQPRIQSSLGSGVIVDASGLIVTNNHVIDGADAVKVALADGREYESTILLKDPRADLAVLKIEGPTPFPVVGLADSDALEIGDLVLAIGNPFGIGQTVTNGIVSALARTHIGVDDSGYFIQTDAAINPGNSGGALIDMQGRLVGVNTSIFTRSGGSNGIGFAIPSNMVRVFVEAAKKGGRLERPFIGAAFSPVTPDVAEALGLDRPSGALVESIAEDGPSEAAGLKSGDVVLAMDGFRVGDPDALGYRLATSGIGKTVKLDVLSGGRREEIDLALEQAPEMPARDARVLAGETPFAGATIANLSPKVLDELDMAQGQTGVVVTDVAKGSFAERFGLQAKDILLSLNGEDVANAKSLEAMAGNATRGWRFDVERDGKRLTQVVR